MDQIIFLLLLLYFREENFIDNLKIMCLYDCREKKNLWKIEREFNFLFSQNYRRYKMNVII